MGLVYLVGQVGTSLDRTTSVEFLVDTGALYTFLPPDLAADLGIEFPVSSTVVMANGDRVVVPVGTAFVQFGDRASGTIVAGMPVVKPLLGALALQALGLVVNSADETVEFSARYTPPTWMSE